MMDRDTLRALVIKYRDEQGLTFQKISDILRDEYEVVRDRQALHGLYTRAKKRPTTGKYKYGLPLTADVLNVYTLGYNMTQVTKLLATEDNKLNYTKVREIIDSEGDFKEDILGSKACKAVELIRTGATLEEIIEEESYNGIKPTVQGIQDIMAEAYAMIIKNGIMNELVEAYRVLGDKGIVEKIYSKLDKQITFVDIKNRI